MAGLKTTSPGILIAPTQRTGRLRRSRLATSRRHNWILRALRLAGQRHSPGRRAIRHPHNQTRLGSPQTNQAQGLPNRPIPRCLHQLQHCQCHLQCCLHQCCPLEPCCCHQLSCVGYSVLCRGSSSASSVISSVATPPASFPVLPASPALSTVTSAAPRFALALVLARPPPPLAGHARPCRRRRR